MITVKISTSLKEWPFFRQTPGCSGRWGDVQFFINDDSVVEADYWVIYEGLKGEERCVCPAGRTAFFTVEPPSIKAYNTKFLAQFEAVITCHRSIRHKNKIYWQQGHPWHVGRRQINHHDISFSKDYDELKSTEDIKKSRLLSVISSGKSSVQGHRDRLKFVSFLRDYFNDKIDIYGRGINEIEDKWDAIAPYKYHIAIENGRYDDWITEKLTDTFLAESYPIYYGAGNIYSYFSRGALSCIDINKPREAVKKIEDVIENKFYEKYKTEIKESKIRVMDRYNLFATIVEKVVVPGYRENILKTQMILRPENYYQTMTQRAKSSLKKILPEQFVDLMKERREKRKQR